jgi:hypothetical protein
MKLVALITLTLVVALILLAGGDWSLQVTIIIPPSLAPYYDWLVNFPGFQVQHESPTTPRTWMENG